MLTWVGAFVLAGAIFAALDLAWRGRIGRPLYVARMGHLMAPRPNKIGAIGFYLTYLVGLTAFVTHPALTSGAWSSALGVGALFGLVCYSVRNFTNLAVVKDFPASIVPIEAAWGTAATACTSVVTYAVGTRLGLG